MRIRNLILAIALTVMLSSCGNDLLMNTVGDTQEEILLRSIWVVGGLREYATTTVVPQVDAFDPVTQTWYPGVTNVPFPVSFAGVAGYQGKIYVMGGFDSMGAATAIVQIYDIATNTWSTGMNMLAARANMSTAVSNGTVYVVNGTTGDATANWTALASVHRYNIASNNWAIGTVLGVSTSNMAACKYGGTIYFLGGRTAAATLAPTPNNHGYVPIVPEFITTPIETALTVPKTGFAADVYTTTGGVSYLITVGGTTTAMTGVTGNDPFYGAAVTAYTPIGTVQYLLYPFTGTTWTTAAQSMPGQVAYGDGLIHDSVYYYMGGTTSGTTALRPSGTNTVYTSNLANFPSNTWQTGPSMPVGRYGHSVVKILEN